MTSKASDGDGERERAHGADGGPAAVSVGGAGDEAAGSGPTDDELRGALGSLRLEPPDEADFRAQLHVRLARLGPPPPATMAARVRGWLDEHRRFSWPAGGVLSGAATFAVLFVAIGGRGAAPGPNSSASLAVASAASSVAASGVAGDRVSVAPGSVARGGVVGTAEVARAAPVSASAAGEVTPTYAVPSSKVAVVKLGFTASVEVAEVMYEVALPEGLSFWSGGEKVPERTFRWPGRLDAGDNVVPIAVRGDRPGRYSVKAKVETEDEIIEHEVILEVQGESG